MSPFTSPAPWTVNASGGARTIVARDRSVVAVVLGGGSAAPFDVGNAQLMAAGPDFMLAARDAKAVGWKHTPGCGTGECWCYRLGAALAKSEQDGGAPEDGPVETETGV